MENFGYTARKALANNQSSFRLGTTGDKRENPSRKARRSTGYLAPPSWTNRNPGQSRVPSRPNATPTLRTTGRGATASWEATSGRGFLARGEE